MSSVTADFENTMLSRFEDETYDLNKEVELSFTKIMQARTEHIFLKKDMKDLIMQISEAKTQIASYCHKE